MHGARACPCVRHCLSLFLLLSLIRLVHVQAAGHVLMQKAMERECGVREGGGQRGKEGGVEKNGNSEQRGTGALQGTEI